jgi:NitT/TauT family transport system substrate-binding protein
LGALLTGCGSASSPGSSPQASATASPVTVKVISLPFISFAPFWIGIDEGYFREQNLQVELVEMPVQQDALAAFISGQVDVSSGMVNAGILNAIAQGAQIRIVADKGYVDPKGCANHAVMARASLAPPGTAVTADLLRGQKIDLVQDSWNHYYLEKLLGPVGAKVDDLQLVRVPSASQPEAMGNGQLDLTVQNEPWVTRLMQAGHRSILAPVQQLMPDAQTAITLYGPKLLGTNAEVGNRFMVAYLKAVRAYNTGKTERNVKTLAKYTDLGEDILRVMCWPALRADGTLNVQSVVDFQTWSVNRGVMARALSVEQFWDPSFVRYANQRLAADGR